MVTSEFSIQCSTFNIQGPCAKIGLTIAYFDPVIKFAVPFGENGREDGIFKPFFAKVSEVNAGVAQLVEHHLAKVRVASSSLVSRSEQKRKVWVLAPHFFCLKESARVAGTDVFLKKTFSEGVCPGGGIGRHAGLKILWQVIAVRVQVPSRVLMIMVKR